LLAYGILAKDRKQWDVHFHLEDGLCEGKTLPLLWDNGAYFDSGCLIGGKLHLFAHFEKKDTGNLALATTVMSTTTPFSRSNTERPTPNLEHLNSLNALHQTGLSISAQERPVKQARLNSSIPRREKRTIVHDLSDSRSYGSSEIQLLLSSSHDDRLSDEEDEVHHVDQGPRSGETQQQLATKATAVNYAIDYDAALSCNASKGKYGHKVNWDDIAKEHKSRIAHAKLIKGIYGLPAPASCERCAAEGVACRVYRPDLQAARDTPGACGECRLRSDTCVMNGRFHRDPSVRKRTLDIALQTPSSKMLRHSIGGESASNLDYCPVVTCPRRKEPFFSKANFLRHIRSAHLPGSSGHHSIDRALDTCCGECRDRNVRCEMFPNSFAKTSVSMEGTSEIQRDDGIETSTETIAIKDENNEHGDGLVESGDYTYDDDSRSLRSRSGVSIIRI
jgi:hypothetical protein